MGECLSRGLSQVEAGAPHFEAPLGGPVTADLSILAAAKLATAFLDENGVEPIGQRQKLSHDDPTAAYLMDSASSAEKPGRQTEARKSFSNARNPLCTEVSADTLKRIRQPDKLAEASFKARHPEYSATEPALLRLRSEEYGELDKQQQVYLDSTGAALASKKQIAEHMALLQRSLLGNPHSSAPGSNPGPSSNSDDMAEETRNQVLKFFNTTSSEYTVIFTSNATGALKLVGESFPFCRNTPFLLCEDSHNSVNGIQCFAQRRGATVTRVPLTREARMDGPTLMAQLKQCGTRGGMFAFPAQSNLTGVRHSLSWIEKARAHGWEVLLDAAAFSPTARLDLRRHKPDFLACSFYKMFGYPTGVGCLLVHNSALPRLANRCWYAGGTVTMVHPDGQPEMAPANSPARYEDGTINFLALPAVTVGIQHLMRVGMDTIGARMSCLTSWFLKELLDLRHPNSSRLVKLYGPTTMNERGATIAFNLLSSQGAFVPLEQVQQRAILCNISLRTGCMCNPMAVWQLLQGSSVRELQGWFPQLAGSSKALDAKVAPEELTREISSMKHIPDAAGVVRISFGLVSTFQDAHAGLQFIRSFLDA